MPYNLQRFHSYVFHHIIFVLNAISFFGLIFAKLMFVREPAVNNLKLN